MRIKLLFRRLFRQKLNNGVIIISLAVGIACVNLISSFIIWELNTDKFHKDYERIYALKCDDPWSQNGKMYHCRDGAAEYMKDNFAQVEDYCRISNSTVPQIIVNNEQYFDKPIIMSASENFFSFFDYELLTNNPETALEAGNNLVISKDLAKKYFEESDPVGKIISLVNRDNEEDMIISGVFKKPVENTQLNFDMVRSMKSSDSRCYVRLSPDTNVEKIEKLFGENKEEIPIIHDGTPGQYYLEPFGSAYFDTERAWIIERNRDKKDLSVALIIGLVIVVVALFNYLGLLNLSLLERIKSFTIQRINGSSKTNIVLSFMGENGVLFLISTGLSFFITFWVAPFFNKITNANITPSTIFSIKQLFTLFTFVLLFLAITYVYVTVRVKSNLKNTTLKPILTQSGKHGQLPAFNIFQLVSSIVLVICSIVILKQIKFISEKPIGLDKGILEISIPAQFSEKVSVFKDELLKSASIKDVSISSSPLSGHFLVLLHYDDNGQDRKYSPAGFAGDEKFISILGIELVQGDDFSKNQNSNKNKCIINESLAKLFPDQNLVGKRLPGYKLTVIGIAKDFHYMSLKSVVEPAYISYRNDGLDILVKAEENQIAAARSTISKIWDQHIIGYPLKIESIGDRYEFLHKENQNYIRLIGSCSFISIFLSVIGLFVISLRSCQYRTKEIGVRKVNGAKIKEILAMLNKDFMKWVALAFIISAPIAWYAMAKWLENFAYKTELNWWIFALGGTITVVIALFTVSFQSLRAASRNPVEALRYE